MRREWYRYSSSRLNPEELRNQLSQDLRDRLPTEPKFSTGVAAYHDDVELVASLDRELGIGHRKDVIRRRLAEVDRRSITEYEYYNLSFQWIATTNKVPAPIVAETTEEFLTKVDLHWPETVEMGIRSLPITLRTCYDQLIILNRATKELFECAKLRGVEYIALTNELWWVRILHRLPDRADVAMDGLDVDPKRQSVVGNGRFFGVRHEQSDYLVHDLQLVDRVDTGDTTYWFRSPQVVASQQFVELCLNHKVNRLIFPHIVFSRGLTPVLVGSGNITSTLAIYGQRSVT